MPPDEKDDVYRDSVLSKTLAAVIIAVLFLGSGASAWALADDFARRGTMPTGAEIDGKPVGGLSSADARRVVEEQVEGPLLAPATLTFRDRSFTLDPASYVTIDVGGMLAAALAPKTDAAVYSRVLARVTGSPVGVEVARMMKVDQAKLDAWVAEVNPQVTVAAVDASRIVTAGALKIVPETAGATIDTATAPAALAKALADGAKNVEIPVRVLAPRVPLAKLGKTIFVRLGKRKLWLYDGDVLEKEYSVAIGMPAYPTPRGWYKIINKRRYPSWSNPGSGWAASMPAYIPPGPGNPLGTRALDLNAPGIRIHGTNKNYSIGTAASHGCMRMHRWDVEELFELVPVGTTVIVMG